MRATYLENISSEAIEIKDEKFHHLINVVRLREHDEVLLLNGMGESRIAIVETLKKKSLILRSKTEISKKEKSKFEVAIAIPKKDALELCLKQAVELGVSKIYLIHSNYSQKMTLSEERLLSILVSALEQSNNHWLPEIENIDSVEAFINKGIKFAYFSSQTERIVTGDKATLIVIGPEAGFNEREEKLLSEEASMLIHFEGAIMRTPTALASGIGYLKAVHQ